MDNEIKGEGNSLNYEFRMHDPRIGRFFATDPLEKKYPWYSPYAFSGNRVIDAVELEGLEPDLFRMQARAGIYGETTQKIVTGVEDETADFLESSYHFVTNYAWKKKTWKNFGNSLATLVICPEPAFDKKTEEFNKEVVNGDAYSRTRYGTNIGLNIATIYIGNEGGILASEALGISKISLLKKFGIVMPKLASLSNLEARIWYLANEAKIPSLIKGFSSLEKQAKAAFNLRNEFRTAARDLMADRKLAKELMQNEKNMTWKQVVEKYSEGGKVTGDDLYKKIIEGSQKSRPSVNESLGVEPKK